MRSVLLLMVGLLSGAAVPTSVIAQSESASRYVTDDFVVGLAVRPAQFLKSDFVTALTEAVHQQDELDKRMQELQQSIGFDPHHAVEVVMLLDKRTIFHLAGLPEPEPNFPEPVDNKAIPIATLKKNLKQLGLAMHNFHDVHNFFADDSAGAGAGQKHLSWRVHLLPFLGQAALYTQFHLDEPWDSDHNKTLIEKMPEVFASNGVNDKGRMSVHLLVGEGALFGGDKPPPIRDIHDGTSNTLLIVMAGADKADVWSKPGGLELKVGAPPKTLGQIGREFLVCLADGSVKSLPADLDPDVFRRLAQHQDNEPTDPDSIAQSPPRLPSWIVRTDTDIDKSAVFASLKPMGNAVEVESKFGTIHTLGDYALAFPDSKTLLAAPADLIPKLLQADGKASTEMVTRLKSGAAGNDVTFVADLQSLDVFKEQLAGNLPMAGVVQSVNFLELALDITGTSKDLQFLNVKTQNAASATQLSALMMGLLQMQKAQMMQLGNADQPTLAAGILGAFSKLMDTTEIKTDGPSVTYRLPKPKDMDAFTKQLKPALQQMFAAMEQREAAARKARQKNALKQLGLAFHNYHDVYTTFPRHDGDGAGRQTGLSWRVHLLPFLDKPQLYNRFHLDEAWDSQHNKTLIAEMPDIFQVEGVDDPARTSIHVFTGPKSPFRDATKGFRIRDFTDGTVNTFLAVEAGPDTADVWTKPGGLKFDGNNGRLLLGRLGASFRALLADGSVRTINKAIDDATLHNLIQPDDGHPVGDF